MTNNNVMKENLKKICLTKAKAKPKCKAEPNSQIKKGKTTTT